MFSGYKMVIKDPSKLQLLSEDMKKVMLKAASNTVNMQAALTRKNAIRDLPNHFILRNTWTQRSIAYDKAPENPTAFEEIASHVGARERAPYMARQENGGKHRPANGGQLSIPTNAARGGSHSSPVQRPMYRNKIHKKMIKYNPTQKNSAGSSLVAAAASAYRENRYLKYGKNIFRVKTFHRTGDSVKFDLEMIYFRGKSSTETKQEAWLRPAAIKPAEDGQKIFNSQMNKLDK